MPMRPDVILLSLLLAMSIPGQASSVGPSNASINGPGWSNLGWNGNGCSGRVETAATGADGKLYLGGVFAACGGVSARNLVRWNPATELFEDIGGVGSGIPDWGVRAIIAVDDHIYVAGNFASAGAVPANSIARFDTNNEQWEALGDGLRLFTGDPGSISELRSSQGELIVRGSFNSAGPVAATGFARFDTQTDGWAALSSVIPTGVSAMAAAGSDLFVAGSFSSVGAVPANRLARFDLINGTWHPLADTGSMTGSNFDLEVVGNQLLVVGSQGTIGSVANTAMAAYDLVTEFWETVADTGGQLELLSGSSLAVAKNSLVLNGRIRYLDASTATGVVQVNSTTGVWDFLASDFRPNSVLGGGVKSIAVSNGVATVVGGFVQGSDPQLFNGARFNLSSGTRSGLGAGPPDTVSADVEAIVPLQSGFILSGLFTQAGSANANNIAAFQPSNNQWDALEGGWGPSGPFGMTALVNVGTKVFVGGNSWRNAAGELQSSVATFDTVSRTWSVPGEGIFGLVYSLSTDGTYVYAGGQFSQAGGSTASNVARYDLAAGLWSALGVDGMEGVDDTVFNLQVNGSDVYAQGNFFTAGGVPAARIARYDTSTGVWHALGDQSIGGLTQALLDFAIVGNELYVAGNEGFPDNRGRLSRFNVVTQDWASETDGPYLEDPSTVFAVRSLVTQGEYLYAGGDFLLPGSTTRFKLARKNLVTGVWTGLLDEADGPIRNIAFNGPYVAVSGLFDYVGGYLNPRFAYYDDRLGHDGFE